MIAQFTETIIAVLLPTFKCNKKRLAVKGYHQSHRETPRLETAGVCNIIMQKKRKVQQYTFHSLRKLIYGNELFSRYPTMAVIVGRKRTVIMLPTF